MDDLNTSHHIFCYALGQYQAKQRFRLFLHHCSNVIDLFNLQFLHINNQRKVKYCIISELTNFEMEKT